LVVGGGVGGWGWGGGGGGGGGAAPPPPQIMGMVAETANADLNNKRKAAMTIGIWLTHRGMEDACGSAVQDCALYATPALVRSILKV
jgi:hypothetical protein